MASDIECVYRAADIGEADIVATWLADQGIEVHVKNRFVSSTLPIPAIISPKGVAVCVINPDDAGRAKALLQEHESDIRSRREASVSKGPIDATCEECGQVSSFPSHEGGRVGICPHCRAHLDVPDC